MIDGRASTTEQFCQAYYYYFLKQYLTISCSQVDIQLAMVAENDLEFLILLILSARIIIISVKYLPHTLFLPVLQIESTALRMLGKHSIWAIPWS